MDDYISGYFYVYLEHLLVILSTGLWKNVYGSDFRTSGFLSQTGFNLELRKRVQKQTPGPSDFSS